MIQNSEIMCHKIKITSKTFEISQNSEIISQKIEITSQNYEVISHNNKSGC